MIVSVGSVFGKLTVLEKAVRQTRLTGRSRVKWVCRCECGNITTPLQYNLIAGKSKSCGCYVAEANRSRLTSHGGKWTRLYKTWSNMRSRCRNKNNKDYRNYGGRGITVCQEWSDFAKFVEWSLSHGYRDDLTIERVNNDGNYCPENCTWATHVEQCRNRSTNRPVVRGDGKVYVTTAEAAKDTNIHPSNIRAVLSGRCKTAGGYAWRDAG